MKRSFLLPAVGLCLLVGCGGSVGDSPGDGGGADGGIDTATGGDGGVDTEPGPPLLDTGVRPDTTVPPTDTGPAACNDLANIGAVTDETRIAAVLPTLAGAASIPSGTYALVANELYTGAGGAAGKTGKTLRETLLVTPGVIQSVLAQNGGADKDSTTTYTIVGTKLHVSGTCGDATSTDVDVMFDVSGATLRLGISIGGTSALLTFEKK